MSAEFPASMKAFQQLGVSLSPEVTLCVRGRHAVGKSQGVYQIAEKIFDDYYKSEAWEAIKDHEDLPWELKGHTYEKGIPVIERRLSQMTEGDIVGLPKMTERSRTGTSATSFKPCDWLLDACEFPVMLFLDERNRALEGVKQAVFQLTDSKAFYGHRLHERTRIIVAENVGDAYTVQACDPAEVSRCATIRLEPTVEEWLDYAKTRAHEFLIDFIREHGQSALEHTGTFEPNHKYQDRRSWMKLDAELQASNLYEEYNHTFYIMACSMVGVAVGSQFANYVKNRDRSVSAKDILADWDKAHKRLRGGTKKQIPSKDYIACVNKVGDYLERVYEKGNNINDDEIINIAKFVYDIPAEGRISLWSKICGIDELMPRLAPHINKILVSTYSNDGSTPARPGSESSSSSAPTPSKKSRGARKK